MVDGAESGGHPQPVHYPQHWEADVVLRDGATAHLRPVLPSDADALQAMHAGQSESSIYLRFFTYKSHLSDRELERFTGVDHVNRVAFVLTLGSELMGIGRFDRIDDTDEAEVAFNISDAHQGRGLGSILLEHLTAAARERGIRTFSAEVLPENRKMLMVFADAGYEVARHFESGVVEVRFDIDPTERSREVMEAREHRSEAQSMSALLSADRIAVVGEPDAGENQDAARLLRNIVAGGYHGHVVAVGVPAPADPGEYGQRVEFVADLSEASEQVQLGFIAVAYDDVAPAIDACAAAGARGVVIMTTGFADAGGDGVVDQGALVRRARARGLRLIGPASLGIVNTAPDVSLNADLSIKPALPGVLGLFSQSAAIAFLQLTSARRRGIGVSTAVSAGNRADVSGNDLMQYWEDDPATSVVGLYLESIGNPRKFSRIARRLSRTKPVIVAKTDTMGLQLPPGHAARTSQAPVGVLDAMLRQSGVIRVPTSDRLMEVAQLLTTQPTPTGDGLGIVTNSLALGTVVADSAAGAGLTLAGSTFSLSPHDGVDAFRGAVDALLAQDDVHFVLACLLPTEGVTPREWADALMESGRAADKPVAAVFVGAEDSGMHEGIAVVDPDAPAVVEVSPGGVDESDVESDDEKDGVDDGRARLAYQPGLPCFIGPGAAIRAIRAAVGYRRWLNREVSAPTTPSGLKKRRASELIEGWLADTSGPELMTLDTERTTQLLECYGISVLPTRRFETDDEAVAAAEELGWPVVLKSVDPTLRRRLDLGAVQLNIPNASALRSEIAQMRTIVSAHVGEGSQQLEVQSMAPTGQSCVLRAVEDPLLGPVVSFGMSGDATTALGDWAHRIPPLTALDVADLIRGPRAAERLLHGGGKSSAGALDLAALEDLVNRVAWLKDDQPEVGDLEFNPVLVSTQGVTVLEARVRIGNADQRTDSARRALRE